jgi:hypothetical protein
VRSLVFAPTLMPKQIEIAALHEIEARSHQADRAVAEVVRLPGPAGWNARYAEQDARDLPVRLAGEMSIERPQATHESSALMLRKMIGRTPTWPAHGKPPQAGRSLGPRDEVLIEWDNDRCRRVGARAIGKQRCEPAIGVVDEPIFALDDTPLEYWSQAADVTRIAEGHRRWRNNNCRGINAWPPDQRCAICWQIRIDRETSAPSVALGVPGSRFGRISFEQPLENRGDSWDCDEGTPTQVQSD